jgi:CBS domain-containing protein
VTDLVRDAMVADPPSLDVAASAQDAGRLLARPEVRAIFVCRNGELAGVVTRKTLVREVVAPGRPPADTPLGDIAEEPHYTLDGGLPLGEAFRFMEDHDAERVPVVDGGRLVGVLSRELVQRRLAEDSPPPDEPELQQHV